MPDAARRLDEALEAGLAQVPEGTDKAVGIRVGSEAAADMLSIRRSDGWDTKVDYSPGVEPGDWQPTPPPGAAAFLPHWGDGRPFVIEVSDRYRPAEPSALDSDSYAADLREVQETGGQATAVRSVELTNAAHFWIGSAVQGWNPLARQASAAKGPSAGETALTLAMLNAGIADALIACFESKYHFNKWRPVTAIRSGAGGIAPDPEWLPLIPTPAFPGFPSAHACAAGAAEAILDHRFAAIELDLELTSATAPGVTFRYRNFTQVADQIDEARIAGGLHVREDQVAGRALGRAVGNAIIESMRVGRADRN